MRVARAFALLVNLHALGHCFSLWFPSTWAMALWTTLWPRGKRTATCCLLTCQMTKMRNTCTGRVTRAPFQGEGWRQKAQLPNGSALLPASWRTLSIGEGVFLAVSFPTRIHLGQALVHGVILSKTVLVFHGSLWTNDENCSWVLSENFGQPALGVMLNDTCSLKV